MADAQGNPLLASLTGAEIDGLNVVLAAAGIEPLLLIDTIGNRPAAGTVNRIFISTDEQTIYRDNGATWDEIAGTPTAAEIRALGFFDITNDGAGSGLDADTVDGLEAAVFVQDAVDIRALGFFDITNDGAGSGLDADLLDGAEGATFATLAGTETFTGDKTFTGAVDLSGSDLTIPADVDLDALGIYNVKDFGAAGDGATDDTAEVQAAIDAARTANGVLYIPKGRYLITDTLWAGGELPTEHLRAIVGEGPNRSILELAIADNGIGLDWAGGNDAWAVMRDLTLRGDDTNTPNILLLLSRVNDGVVRSGGQRVFERVRFDGDYSITAVYNLQSETNYWAHCFFENNTGRSCHVLTDSNIDSITSENVTLDATSSSTMQIFNACHFNNLRTGVLTNNSCLEIEDWQSVRVRDCFFNSGDSDIDQIRLINTSTTLARRPADIEFVGVYFHGTMNSAVRFDNGTGGTAQFLRITTRDNFHQGTVGTADIVAEASTVIISCNLEAETSILASAATILFQGNCKLELRIHTGGTINLGGTGAKEGRVIIDSANTLNRPSTATNDFLQVYFPDLGLTIGPPVSTLTIASGVITTDGRPYHLLNGQGGAADTLDTIDGGTTGQRLVLSRGNADITINDGGGNINIAGALTLDSVADRLELHFNGTTWNELSRADNA